MAPTRTTTRDIRRLNRSALLSRLFFDGPRSRLELGQLTGLSAATVSTVTGELMDDGLVIEAGQVGSNGGRPRVLLRVDPAYGYVVGVDVGETGVTVERFDLAMERRARFSQPLPSTRPSPDDVAASIAAGFEAVMSQEGERADPAALLGVGVGVPGIVETGGADVLVHTPTIGWSGVPLARLLAARGVGGPIHVDNGAKTQAQAEVWFGAARGARHAIVALIGSGVGAAITTGESYQGASSSAAEWGHTVVQYAGRPCRCGDQGHLEAYVGAEAILERWAEIQPAGAATSATGSAGEQAGLAALIEAAGERGSAASELLAETVDILGAGIGSLINICNPERVVLGGWAGLALGEAMLPQIRSSIRTHALSQPYGRVAIELSELGTDAVALGAATLPLAEFLLRGERPVTV